MGVRCLTATLILLAAIACERRATDLTRKEPPKPDAVRELDASAACAGNEIAIRNNNREAWTNVRIIIDETASESGFTYTVPRLEPREGIRLSPSVFTHPTRKRAGTEAGCTTLSIHADTPRGPAHWYGGQ
jgi:hypothetical protein